MREIHAERARVKERSREAEPKIFTSGSCEVGREEESVSVEALAALTDVQAFRRRPHTDDARQIKPSHGAEMINELVAVIRRNKNADFAKEWTSTCWGAVIFTIA